MESPKHKKVLIAGASFAGLSTAYWMNKQGYSVTVVEIAEGLKKGGTPVNIEEGTVDIVKRMGIFEQVKAQKLHMEYIAFKNADDVTEGSTPSQKFNDGVPADDCEIERDTLLHILFDAVKNDVEFIFGNSITSLAEAEQGVAVNFKNGSQDTFHLVFGCDGLRSSVRRMWFGEDNNYMHFLHQYFSITIVNKLLIQENTSQMYNVPGKATMLNAYNGKTDIIFCFTAKNEIPYNYRDEAEQRKMIYDQFAGGKWRTAELLEEIKNSDIFYFDKLCQIKMPSWTKGRVALVGDAAYCASPAAGKGGSLAIDGAAALADAFQKYPDNYELAFSEYNESFRPFIEEVQETVINIGLDTIVPQTEEAIRRRNTEGWAFNG